MSVLVWFRFCVKAFFVYVLCRSLGIGVFGMNV